MPAMRPSRVKAKAKQPASAHPQGTADVEAVFKSYPADVRGKLLALRQLIFATAAETAGVGPLEETLKWGQPSYLTPETKAGSTIRIDRLKCDDGQYAMYVHCQTDLIETFRELYPTEMTFFGNRSIIFSATEEIPVAALRHCIALALTYHRRKALGPHHSADPIIPPGVPPS